MKRYSNDESDLSYNGCVFASCFLSLHVNKKRLTMDADMKRLERLIADLNEMGKKPFIGYGNPNADILIVGKECAEEDKERQEKFYSHNFEQWEESLNGHGFGYKNISNVEPYDFEHGYFHPIYPFYKQLNKIGRRGDNHGKTSSTYYYYQKLLDKLRARDVDNYSPSSYVDFFKDCFITELNDICRRNNKGLKKDKRQETEYHIRERFDWMRRTNFFNQFKVVILACGPYAGAIKKDECLKNDLFGNAEVYYCNQLSRWDKKLDEEIIPRIIKSLV